MRAGGRVRDQVRWVAEWRWHGFAERFFGVEDFRAHEASFGFQANPRVEGEIGPAGATSALIESGRIDLLYQ